MVKQRLTTADVAAEVSCLKRLLGMRLANIYDINPKVASCACHIPLPQTDADIHAQAVPLWG